MADNVAITAGSGTTIATDEVAVNGGSSAHVQFVKLVDGASNGTSGISGSADGLYVISRRDILRVSVESAGLTTATTAYAAGDQVGNQFTISNAARSTGGSGYITGITLIDKGDVTGPIDVFIFDSSVSLASDNAAFAISDTDALKLVAYIPLSGSFDITNNRIAQAVNLSIPYVCSGGTSLYAGLRTVSAHTFFGAATDLQLIVYMERS